MTDRQWDDLADPARIALEALIKSGDNMADRIEELEAKLAKAVAELERLGFDFQCVVGRELKGEKS